MKTAELFVTKDNLITDTSVASLVQRACIYQSRIDLRLGQARINAKSLMGLFLLVGKEGGFTLRIEVSGPDEQEALNGIVRWLSGQESSIRPQFSRMQAAEAEG